MLNTHSNTHSTSTADPNATTNSNCYSHLYTNLNTNCYSYCYAHPLFCIYFAERSMGCRRAAMSRVSIPHSYTYSFAANGYTHSNGYSTANSHAHTCSSTPVHCPN